MRYLLSEAENLIEYSVLIGGKAGDGIAQAGQLISSLFSELGYHVYQYTDYPSLIRGGHNFCIIRAAEGPVGAHRSGIDFILALDQKTPDLHAQDLNADGTIIFDSSRVKASGQGINIPDILNLHQGLPIMGNTAIIGAFCRCIGIPWDRVSVVLGKKLQKESEKNLDIAREAYGRVKQCTDVTACPGGQPRPLLSGNEWIGIGLLAGGIDAYIAYPMTPSSGILHYLASIAGKAGIDVIHPESEIAVILMALGYSYAGKKVAVGTSGGGFCLMTEGLSLSGMAELPVVIVLSQRGGPSTGLPTYTSQSDLLFACHAGQGEFPRLVVAPGSVDEAYFWSAQAVQIAWQYQIPALILSDKTLSEGIFTSVSLPEIPAPIIPDDYASPYMRYADMPDGISPPLSPPVPGEVIKVNSYAHDLFGITTEEPEVVVEMIEKRLRKSLHLASALDRPGAVCIGGISDAPVAILCWGSVRGVCLEVAQSAGLRVISPIVMVPFPALEFKSAMKGVLKMILVEDSTTGQLSQIIAREGYHADAMILRYDGRPFSVEELYEKIRGHLK
jgi:2-oxoglutarate ferredoxin oxidoreductase subunit alpha